MKLAPDVRICLKMFLQEDKYYTVHVHHTCSHQGKKDAACIVSKPLVFCLWGCRESVNRSKLNIQELQGATCMSSRSKGDPDPLSIFQDFFTFKVKSQPSCIQKLVSASTNLFIFILVNVECS